MIRLDSDSPARTAAIGQAIAHLTRPGDVIGLDGELGAGKTRLVAGLAQGLGVDPRHVSSPTFVLMHEYEGGRTPLIHLDAYRLRSPGELDELGFDELRREAVTAVEWACRVADALGGDQLQIFIEHAAADRRVLTIQAHGSWRDRLAPLEPIPCSICRTPAFPALPTYPFCSTRCRQVDLARWFGEDYRITRPIEQSDLEET